MTNQLLTVGGLVQLRARRDRLQMTAAAIADLGHQVPASLADELRELPAAVNVEISCLLCGTAAAYTADVDSDATPHAAICTKCDQRCSVEPGASS